MKLIDRYAYSARIRMIDPAHKLALVVSVIVLCLLLDRPLVGFVAVLGMWALASGYAGIPVRVFGGFLAAEASFLLMAVVGVAVSVGPAPSQATEWGIAVGPWWVGANQSSLELSARLVARALGGASAMNFLALTTPLIDLIDVSRRLRLPPLLIDLMVVVYRFVFTLLDTAAGMHIAQESRLGYVNFRRGMASAGMLGAQLFVDSYRRGKRLQTALESRGYDGDLRVLPGIYRTDPAMYCAGAILLGAMLWAWSVT